MEYYSLEDIVDSLNGEREKKQSVDFIQFSKEWLLTTNINEAKNYMSAVNSLVVYIVKEHWDINKITILLLFDLNILIREDKSKS